MLSETAKTEIFNHIKESVLHQRRIRRCEIEGMVCGLEKDLEQFQIWGFLSFEQEDQLLALLKES
jgi:hypothetical protein